MKLLAGLVALGILMSISSAFAQVPGCFAHDPHSFACQQGTFFGRIFPLVSATPQRLAGNWKTLVFSSVPSQTPLLRGIFSRQNPRIPTGVLNSDSTLVGTLFWPGKEGIRFNNFRVRGNHLQQISGVRLSDKGTAQVPFFNSREGTRELLICRIFLRNRTEHLLCQWLRSRGQGFQLQGYLGFIR